MEGTAGSCPSCGSPSVESVNVKRSAVTMILLAILT